MNREFGYGLRAAALGFALLGVAAACAAAALDGKSFVADSGPKGKPATEKEDVLSFRDGRFHSSICDKYGFGTGAYQATSEGGTIRFATETLSDKDGRLAWQGTVQGDAIEGSYVHYRKPGFLNRNPEPREYWFKGKLKPGS